MYPTQEKLQKKRLRANVRVLTSFDIRFSVLLIISPRTKKKSTWL
jgi:hypothetical protein